MRVFHFVLAAVILALAADWPARAEDVVSGSVFEVSYFEAAAPDIAATAGLARAFAAASRREPGNEGFGAFQEIGRPSRYALFSAWHDHTVADIHRSAATTAAFHDKLKPILVGPFEIRTFSGFSLAPSRAGGVSAVYVLTHVDVFPGSKDEAADLLTALAEAARKMPGNLLFDVVRVDGHPNHFTVCAGWDDPSAFDAFQTAAPTKDFRRRLTPLEGALYDERLYRALP
jgi:quinol monooxygenase YgiN